MKNFTDLTLLNLSVPGVTMSRANEDLFRTPWNMGSQTQMMNMEYGLFGLEGLIIMLGTNDALQAEYNSDQFVDDYLTFVRNCKGIEQTSIATTKYFLISPVWANESENTVRNSMVRQKVRDVASATGSTYVEGLTLVDHDNRYFDGLHMTNDGHTLFSERLFDAIGGSI